MTPLLPVPEAFDVDVEVLIVGAGAAGMIAALSAHERGRDVLLLEADAVPTGSTALSAGLIPAAGTRLQREAGIDDTPELFARDIMKKAKGANDPALVEALAEGAAEVIDWLSDAYGLPFSVVSDFSYPGHSRRRMHGLPSRAGRELIDRLRSTVENLGIPVIAQRRVQSLHADGKGAVRGVTAALPDGGLETVGCAQLILACNGFGGNREMVRQYMPEIGEAVYFGHAGNRGDAIRWGEALGAGMDHLGAYQGHGNVAHPHGILISWAVITEGGVQVNLEGRRFWDESQGYSEAARAVLAQPEGVAWAIFDERIAGIARQFADFQDAEAQGAVLTADSLAELAAKTSLPATTLEATLSGIGDGEDPFGRSFDPTKPLGAPYRAVRVTGTLFHTQGGLDITPEARVRRSDGTVFPNLFAVGGAATGVSGTGDYGYLSGNGLLAAAVLGRIAGKRA
ncbi:FAD-dependent oxidoreductase (plasmid) [Sulfitobacter sp. LCG007]